MVNNQFSILNKKNIILLLCFTFGILTSSGCSYNKTEKIETPHSGLKTNINKSIANLYPDKFKAIHHVILSFSGKDYVLDGYLSVDRVGREIKLIAQNDLSGIIFEIGYVKNIEKTIHININMLKKKWLENSVLRDLETLYLMEPFPSPTVLYDQHRNLVLSQTDDQITKELVYTKIGNSTQYRLSGIRHLANKKCFYTIHLQYSAASDKLYPEFILIKDEKMKYALQISVRYFM